jgi:hypothetical protein
MKSCAQINELINMYIDNELTTTEKIEFERHINICGNCKQNYIDLMSISNALRDVSFEELPEEFSVKLHNRLLEETIGIKKEQKNYNSKKILNFSYYVAAVFVVVIFSKWGYSYFLNGNRAQIVNESVPSLKSESKDETRQDKYTGVELDNTTNAIESGKKINNNNIEVIPSVNELPSDKNKKAAGNGFVSTPVPLPTQKPTLPPQKPTLPTQKPTLPPEDNISVAAKSMNLPESETSFQPSLDISENFQDEINGQYNESLGTMEMRTAQKAMESPSKASGVKEDISVVNIIVTADNPEVAKNNITKILNNTNVVHQIINRTVENKLDHYCVLTFKVGNAKYNEIYNEITKYGYKILISEPKLTREKEVLVSIMIN